VAHKHYWQVTDADYERAIQKAQKKTPQDVGMELQMLEGNSEKPGDCIIHRVRLEVSVLPDGLEPSTY
jgi:hypothetical protein